MKRKDSTPIPSRVAQAAAKFKTCSVCGKLFLPKMKEDICLKCFQKKETDEQNVIDYLRHNQNASVEDLAKACNVPHSFVRHMVDAGKFDGIGDSLRHPCKMCGDLILIGDYCYDCSIKMKGELEAVKESIKENVRMAAEAKEYATKSRLRSMIGGDSAKSFFRHKK